MKIIFNEWNKRRFFTVVIVMVILIAVAIIKSGGNTPAESNKSGQAVAVPVKAVQVAEGSFKVYFSSLGTVEASSSVTVRSQVDGELTAIYFQDGQLVNAGDLLAEIDPRSYQAQVEQAEGQILRDQALLDNARQNLARSKLLVSQKAGTQQDYETYESQVRQYEGVVKIDQGQLNAAKLQLCHTRITAPISGRLGLRQVDAGNIISASDPGGLVLITQVRPIDIIFTVTEDQLPQVMKALGPGNGLTVEAWNRDQSRLLSTGKLVSLDNQIDVTTGTVKLKAEFANDDETLFPNQFVNARILVETLKSVSLVPTEAILLSDKGRFVYLVSVDNIVEMRFVKTGPGDNKQTVISEGVRPGDLVVIDGIDALRDKSKVVVSNQSEIAHKNAADQKKAKHFGSENLKNTANPKVTP